MGEVRFMISEAAKQVRVESHVLRYWEEELDLKIGRTEMGHRYYTEDDIQLFRCIKKLKNEGMLLRDLKPLIPELTATRKKLAAAKPSNGSSARDSRQTNAETGLSDTEKERSGARSAQTDEKNTYPGTKSAHADEKNTYSGARSAHADGEHTYSGTKSAHADGESGGSDIPVTAKSPEEPADGKFDTDERRPDIPAELSVSQAEVIPVTQLEQVRSLIGDVLTEVVTANNESLEKNISRKVTTDVIREMDFLFQAKERQEEEHFRKLDCLIRQQQASRREAAKESPLGKLKKILT